MDGDYISRQEHETFAQLMKSENTRLQEEDTRQNKRIGTLEEKTDRMYDLAASVEKLALSIESMAKEQEKWGKRLEALERRDGEMWRKVVGHVINTVVGIIIGYIFLQIGI